jgi:hypothetical protein
VMKEGSRGEYVLEVLECLCCVFIPTKYHTFSE